MNTRIIKDLVPPALLKFITGRFYGWSGNYKNWESARQHSDGYDRDFIIDKVKSATRKVISGKAKFERDGVEFEETQYNYELLSALSFIKLNEAAPFHVIDFGGSLGSLYWQHRDFLLPQLVTSWNVIEQDHYVTAGINEFRNEQLNFFYSVEDCLASVPAKLVVLSSVLQYLPDPWSLLDTIIRSKIKWLFIDRAAFIKGDNDRLTIQKVHPAIYKATYPCWFLSENRFRKKMLDHYDLLFEFDALDNSNLSGTSFRGMFLRLK
jgi:putative methyltransferase (TIGR04325 family)